MERKGELLESGIFGENYYGTPKPPKDPKKLNIPVSRGTSQEDKLSDSSFKKEFPAIDSHHVNNAGQLKQQRILSKSLHEAIDTRHGSLGPLPANWEIAFTEENEKYFIK